MRKIKCKYCGKSYASPSEMRKRKCHSHPKGAWGGYCSPDYADATFWGIEKHCESLDANCRKIEQNEEEFRREYKTHTPLFDCMLSGYPGSDTPTEYKLEIRNSDLNDLALEFANGINAKTRDAINTVYALRAGCDYVLDNEDAQKEGSFGTWLDEVKQLKDEVVSWDFWVALYYLTKPLKDQADAAKRAFENDEDDGNNFKYWCYHSIAEVFHVKYVIPMLHAVNKKGDEKENEVMNLIESRVAKLKSDLAKEKDSSSSLLRSVEKLCRRIHDYSFWGIVYCLYWMKLRPTPWNDQKVWPIQSDEYGW